MSLRQRSLSVLTFVIVLSLSPLLEAQQIVGGPLGRGAGGDCVGSAEQALIQAAIAQSLANPLPEGAGPPAPPVPLYPFYPVGGILGDDIKIGLYNDLDPTFGVLDFDGFDRTYDGHEGSDCGLKTFDEQVIGVPVFAVLPGVVTYSHDGEPDMNTQNLGQPANYVIIDHGNGRVTWYFHLKNGSVLVNPGDPVALGQQIGLVASSGNSSGPHLHFGSYDGNTPYEPFAGVARPGPSAWKNQYGSSQARLVDFAVTDQDPFLVYPPQSLPRGGWVTTTGGVVNFWTMIADLPANSTWNMTFRRPNGTVEYASTPYPFFNTGPWGDAWFGFVFNLFAIGTTPGTWSMDVIINGQILVTAPFEVLSSAPAPGYNRPPASIQIQLQPSPANAHDPVICDLTSTNVLDDPDYDILTMTYVWKVNGNIVRQIASAGRRDMLDPTHFSLGDQVSCTVTASDGLATTSAVTATTTIVAVPNAGQVPQPGLAVLDINAAVNADSWPVSSGRPGVYANAAAPGQPMTIKIAGESNQPIVFLAGPKNVQVATYPNIGQFDIGGPLDLMGIPLNIYAIGNGLSPQVFFDLQFNTFAGELTLGLVTPNLQSGVFATFQAAVLSSNGFFFALSNAVEFEIL